MAIQKNYKSSISLRYSHSILKKYDGIEKGSASLWSARLLKGFGILSESMDHNKDLKPPYDFNYSKEQIKTARVMRSGFYERIFSHKGIISALPYSPIVLDLELFSSINGDREGVITLPDEDDKKEDFSHSVNVLAYCDTEQTLSIDTGWRNWGDKGLGKVSYEYVDKYMLSAWYSSMFALLSEKRGGYKSKNFVINNQKWTFKVYTEFSVTNDTRRLLNLEIYNNLDELCGWVHYAYNELDTFEILDLFILDEYRRIGLASFIINELKKASNIKRIYGHISAHDLIDERNEIVKSFFLKNDFILHIDYSHFKDCRFRFEYTKN